MWPRPRLFARAWDVLIDKDRVAVRINEHQACGPRRGFICGSRQSHASTFERPLDGADIIEIGEGCAVPVLAGVVRQEVLLEQPLKKSDRAGLVLKNEPVLGLIAADRTKTKHFVERTGRSQILDSETDRKVAEPHGVSGFLHGLGLRGLRELR